MQAFVFCPARNNARNKHAVTHVIITCRDTAMPWIDHALNLMNQGWLGTLLGILGIVFGLATYLWTRKRTSLSYAYLGEHLLGSKSDALPEGINVQYKGEDIPRLTRSVIVLWNSGENTIMGSDLVDIDPLRFCIETDGELLSVSILKASRPVNDFKIRHPSAHAPNEAIVEFNYFDSRDGVVVEILHTSASRQPDIKGTLRGLPKGLNPVGRMTRSSNPFKRTRIGKVLSIYVPKISVLVPIIFGGGFMLTGLFATPEVATSVMTFNFEKPNTAVMTMGATYVGFGLFSLYLYRRKYPKNLHIEALE